MPGLSPIGVGIVGTGRISDLHALGYRQSQKARIVALCDQDAELAKRRARQWGCEGAAILDSYSHMLARRDVDLVEILLPHHLHYWAAMKAIEAGKIVSLQKPICLSLAEADSLVEAAEASGRPFKVFENFVFFPPVAKARDLIDNGAIGTPLFIRIKSNPGKSKSAWNVPDSALAWRLNREKSGGGPLVFDDGHHKFALAWHFMGIPEEVHAFIGSTAVPQLPGTAIDAASVISFRFPDNRAGSFEVVYSPELEIETRTYAQDDRVEITGTQGIIWINCGHGFLRGTPPLAMHRDGVLTEFHDIETDWRQSFVLSTRHFLDAIESGGNPVLTARQGREILHIALAAEESARTGKTMAVSPRP